MARSLRRSTVCCLLLIASLFAVLVPGTGARLARAQSIECASAPSPAADSPATPVAPVISDVAFPVDGGELTVFAAASLTESFNAIKESLEAAHPDLTITYNFAGSQALVTQLTEGAEADVFAAANAEQMQAAVENGVIAGEPVVFARNRLAVVVPAGNPAGLDSFADLGNEGIKLVLAQPEVPVGQYAREAICMAGADAATYGEGFVENVATNIVSEETSVKAVLTKIRLGEADAGVVYTSDITADIAGEVTLIEIPETVNIIATYPISPVAGGDPALATAFIAYLLSPEGQAVLETYGFQTQP